MNDRIVYTRAEKKESIRAGICKCLEEGITVVQTNEWDTDSWAIYKELLASDELPIRIFYTMLHSHLDAYSDILGPTIVNDFLCCERVKVIADGSLGSETAALSLPYSSSEENYGMFCYSQEELTGIVRKAVERGFRMEIHAIGDACAERVLNSFSECPSSRPNLTHCQFLSASLIERMSSLGVVANVQPQMVASDGCWVTSKVDHRLLNHAYAWKTIKDSGIVLAGGSDAPIEDPRPCLGIYDAVFREKAPRDAELISVDSAQTKIFRPEERLDVVDAIDAYTTGSAWAAGRDDRLGKLEPGYLADFTIMADDSDVVTCPKLWLSVRVGQVWVGGIRRK